MLTNLAVNAKDAMPEGGELKFRLSPFTLAPDERPPLRKIPPGEWIVLSVLDTGSGIPPEIKEHIFEPLGQGETILVVEDEPGVLATIRDMLEQAGYQVLMATNGQEGVGMYDKHNNEIALVLTDMVMPVMGGVELFHMLKAQNPDVKVVVISGYPLGEEAGEFLSQGIVGWMQKPVDFPKLVRIVHETLT